MEDEARVDVEPAHRAIGVVAAQHTQTGTVAGPPTGTVSPAFRSFCCVSATLEVEQQRQVQENDMVGGQREVVHQRQRGDVDGAIDGQLAVGVRAVIDDMGFEDVAAPEEMHFTGSRADLRMRGHRIRQLAAEVVGAQRFQVIADFIGQREFHQRKGFAGVANDMGIGDAGVQVSGAVVVVERGTDARSSRCAPSGCGTTLRGRSPTELRGPFRHRHTSGPRPRAGSGRCAGTSRSTRRGCCLATGRSKAVSSSCTGA